MLTQFLWDLMVIMCILISSGLSVGMFYESGKYCTFFK